MAADNILGKLIIEGANQAASMAGGSPSLGSGLAGGDGSNGNAGGAAGERETRGFQKTIKDANVKAVGLAKDQPKWWTKMFKTLGIQMGLAGILKQSQVFTSTVGAFFQIFGAMVDVMLAPLIKPVLMPLMRWFARQIPTMGRLSKAFFGFVGSTIMGLIGWVKKIGGWISDGWDWTKKLFSAEWWKKAFSTVVSEIAGLPRKIYNEILKLFSWNTWANIFRSLWNSTLGGVRVGSDKFGFTFPTWNGGSTHQKTNDGSSSETIETRDNDENIISYAANAGGSGLIERAYKSGLDKDGNILKGANGKAVLLGNYAWKQMFPDGTLTEYKKYMDDWKKSQNDVSLTDTLKGGAGDVAGQFKDLHIGIKASLAALGIGVSAMYLKDLGGSITSASSSVIKGVLSPIRAVKGIMDGLMAQIKIGDQKSFIKHLREGKGVTGSLKAALSHFQLGFQPSAVTDVPNVTPRGVGGPDIPTTNRSIGDVNRAIRSGMPVADDGAGARSSKATSTLVKARMLLSQLTSWLSSKLTNLKSLMSPTAFQQAQTHLSTKSDEIMNLLKTIPDNTPGVASIVGRLGILKSFLARAIPLVGAAVGAVMTAKNIKTILGTDLSWFTANENTKAAQETNAQIADSLKRVSGAMSEGEELWKEGGIINKVKAFGAWTTAGVMGQNVAAEAQQGYMSHTKGGAILNQLLMGTVSTGTGLFGVAGMPAGTSAAVAQQLAMADINNNDKSIDLYNQMLLSVQAGAKGIGSELNIKVDGHDGTMDVPW